MLLARTASAFVLQAGDVLGVVNVTGTQVVDAWAFVPPDGDEHLSMEHTRGQLSRIVPRTGDALYSNRRRILAVLSEDTSPGVHDTLIPACDPERYRSLGVRGDHASCADNYRRVLAGLGLAGGDPPAPLNLFMNVPWDAQGELEFRRTVASPGDRVELTAAVDLIFVLSACPMDVNAINGHEPSDVAVEVRSGGRQETPLLRREIHRSGDPLVESSGRTGPVRRTGATASLNDQDLGARHDESARP